MKLQGKRLDLIPIKTEEKEEFYQLATQSYGSKFWYDEEEKVEKTRKKFFKDWKKEYFDLASPEKGQCFWIVANDKRIGQVNYNPIDKKNKKVELDIIIGSKESLGRGYGPEALKVLMKYLFANFDINKIWIEARTNNPRAIKAYEKAGFKKEGLLRQENHFEGKFVNCVRFGILKREFVSD